MEEILKSIQAKLQSFKTLPQAEYRAIGEHLLPQINNCLQNLTEYRTQIKDIEEGKFMYLIRKRADLDEVLYIDFMGYSYGISVSKTKLK